MDPSTQTIDQSQTTTLSGFFASIYSWMVAGLLISSFFAYIAQTTGIMSAMIASPVLFYGTSAIQLAILIGVQFAINKLPVELSRGLYFVYAALSGLTLSWIFTAYTTTSILGVFMISAGLFGGLAIWGYTTKKDLSGWRTALFAGMIGVFVSSLVNIFLQNSVFDIIVSAAAILVFCGLTAYDNQAYKAIYHQNVHDNSSLKKFATLGALHMYVNFIMIFINILRFFGSSND